LQKSSPKLLANRLAPRLPLLVSPNQSTFVKGRCIYDNFELVQHTAKALHKQKIPRILFKLDIGKAFDSVSWPFLLVNGEPGDVILSFITGVG
jgi:hypothetical protein